VIFSPDEIGNHEWFYSRAYLQNSPLASMTGKQLRSRKGRSTGRDRKEKREAGKRMGQTKAGLQMHHGRKGATILA